MFRTKEIWNDPSTNAAQQYLTHGIFRYFGKLPPTLTGMILDAVSVSPGRTVIDVMCGSGTTLVEAGLRGARGIGIDCNPASVLISKVKTTALAPSAWIGTLDRFQAHFGDQLFATRRAGSHKGNLSLEFSSVRRRRPPVELPCIPNFSHWFEDDLAQDLAQLRSWVQALEEGPAKDLARVAFLACVRPCSRASVRIGRLFRDVDKKMPNVYAEFAKRFEKCGLAASALAADARWASDRIAVFAGDAKATGLAGPVAIVFCHPPYFGLYKYSSDVLRFELEWMRANRKAVSRIEICDGFKTTDEGLVKRYVSDMKSVAVEAARLTTKGGKYVVVTADSTLRKKRLPILAPLIEDAESVGWTLVRRITRRVRYAQASYHRSADAEIHRPDDEILVFERT